MSFAIINELSFINVDNCEISKALPLSKMHNESNLEASFISPGPGANTILNSSLNLFLIFSIN